MTQANQKYYLGVTTGRRPDWQTLCCDPVAPANYTPKRAARFVANKLAAQDRRAAKLPYTGYVRSLTILDHTGSLLLRSQCGDDETATASLQFINFMLTSPAHWINKPTPVTLDDTGIRWFCFNANYVIPMLIAEVQRYNWAEGKQTPVHVPIHTWMADMNKKPQYADPYKLLVPASLRADMDVYALCDFLGIETPTLMPLTSEVRASLARQVAIRGQLLPR